MTGQGVRGEVQGRRVALGNRTLMDAMGVDVSALAQKAEARRTDGQTVMFVGGRRAPRWPVGVADPIKEGTPEAIEALHREGVRIVMLTGDSRTTAQAVARTLHLDEVVAEVLPDQKAGP